MLSPIGNHFVVRAPRLIKCLQFLTSSWDIGTQMGEYQIEELALKKDDKDNILHPRHTRSGIPPVDTFHSVAFEVISGLTRLQCKHPLRNYYIDSSLRVISCNKKALVTYLFMLWRRHWYPQLNCLHDGWHFYYTQNIWFSKRPFLDARNCTKIVYLRAEKFIQN